jgi:hypothetical protein
VYVVRGMKSSSSLTASSPLSIFNGIYIILSRCGCAAHLYGIRVLLFLLGLVLLLQEVLGDRLRNGERARLSAVQQLARVLADVQLRLAQLLRPLARVLLRVKSVSHEHRKSCAHTRIDKERYMKKKKKRSVSISGSSILLK